MHKYISVTEQGTYKQLCVYEKWTYESSRFKSVVKDQIVGDDHKID